MAPLSGDDEVMSATEEDVPFLQDETVSPPPYTSVAVHTIPTTEDQNRREVHLKRRLYISHFLSTWNSRTFEFATILVVARLFQETLLPVSIYALFRAGSAICFAPFIGRYVDCGDRLKTVRFSISMNYYMSWSKFRNLEVLPISSWPKASGVPMAGSRYSCFYHCSISVWLTWGVGYCCVAAYPCAFWVHGEALLDYEFDCYRTRLGKP